MGQRQSSDMTQSRVQDVPQVKNMSQKASGHDIRFGDIKVMEYSANQLIFAVKPRFFPEEEQWKKFKVIQEEKIHKFEKEEYLIKLLDLQHQTENELCSSVTKAYQIFEYYPHDLKKDIEEMSANEKEYEEIEIVAMIYFISSALITLNLQRYQHGDLRPVTVLMTQHSLNNPHRSSAVDFNPLYKITNLQDLTGKNAYARCLEDQNDDYNLSPEQLNSLKALIYKPQFNAQQSDVFSLGLVAAQMANTCTMQDIYDQSTKSIKHDLLNNYIQRIHSKYSKPLSSLIESMLNYAPEARPDFMALHTHLTRYSTQIEDYITGCSKHSLPLTFSLSHSGQSVVKLSKPSPKTSQVVAPPEPKRPSYSKYEIEKMNQLLHILDTNAKHALHKSQQVQLQYQEAPYKQYCNRRDFVPLTYNFDTYSNLNPIVVNEEIISTLSDSLFRKGRNSLIADQLIGRESPDQLNYQLNNIQTFKSTHETKTFIRQGVSTVNDHDNLIYEQDQEESSKQSSKQSSGGDLRNSQGSLRSKKSLFSPERQKEEQSKEDDDEQNEQNQEPYEDQDLENQNVEDQDQSKVQSLLNDSQQKSDTKKKKKESGDVKKTKTPAKDSAKKDKSPAKEKSVVQDKSPKVEKSVIKGAKTPSKDKSVVQGKTSKVEKSVVNKSSKVEKSVVGKSKSPEKSVVGKSKSPQAEKSVVGKSKSPEKSVLGKTKSPAEKSVVGKSKVEKSVIKGSKAEKSVVDSKGIKKSASPTKKTAAEKSVSPSKKK